MSQVPQHQPLRCHRLLARNIVGDVLLDSGLTAQGRRCVESNFANAEADNAREFRAQVQAYVTRIADRERRLLRLLRGQPPQGGRCAESTGETAAGVFGDETGWDRADLCPSATSPGHRQWPMPDYSEESLSLALDIGELCASTASERKTIIMALRRYHPAVLRRIQGELAVRPADRSVEHPVACASRLARIFSAARLEAEGIQPAERRRTFDEILAAAVAHVRNGHRCEALRDLLVQHWPKEPQLIERVLNLAIGSTVQ